MYISLEKLPDALLTLYRCYCSFDSIALPKALNDFFTAIDYNYTEKEDSEEVDVKVEKTYYIGTYEAYLHITAGLNKRDHVYCSSYQSILGLTRNVKIISVGPIEASITTTCNLIDYGYHVLRYGEASSS